MSKICVECGCKVIPSNIQGLYYCTHCEELLNATDDVRDVTLFDRITASPEVLAESSVYFAEEYTLALEGSEYGVTFPGGWTSPFIEYTYGTKPEAIAATVAKLKEVCDGND